MGGYAEALRALNTAQAEAVKTIDGPVLVVAGPGTGKTQLLSVRVGAILQADAAMLPSNILCLTFTDAAAANLRERLIEKIGLGQAAYQVAIHTFNSFGSWIMATYPEYFFAWREATTADELTSYRLLESILQKLPGDHPLAAQSHDDSFFATRQVQNFIGDCKRANLSPQEVANIIDANQATYELYAPLLAKHWPARMTDKDALPKIAQCITTLEAVKVPGTTTKDITDLLSLVLQGLHAAQAESDALVGRSKTKPFTAWKDDWLELDAEKRWIFKAAKHYAKLAAAADIYAQYQKELDNQGMVDFNDQIMAVLAALENHEELRLNLQERFQYVMIDEYQDTNRAQLQMARHITDASVHEGRPNIMVVGDDDQAIYRFQGADMSNIAAFEAAYKDPKIIWLDQNYRSNQAVLTPARSVSTQIALSLEKLKGISKELGINVVQTGQGTRLHEFEHETQHYAWIAAEICKLLDAGGVGKDIAVLARKRDQLDALVPYLRDQHIPMDYERRENVLEQHHVVALLTLARAVYALSEQRLQDANALLPEVLSHPMWAIPPVDLWRIAREAHTDQRLWLDVIFEQEGTPARAVADFLFSLSQQAGSMPLEHTLDVLIGLQSQSTADDVFISPFKTYYFGDDLFNQQPAAYLTLLSHLACLRRHIRAYQQGTDRMLTLADLIQFVDSFTRAGLTMTDTAAHREDTQAVRLMTTHKAKGLEFGTVFIIGVENDVWHKSGGNRQRFSYPNNLQEIKPSDNDDDDALRLLFVAMTRAKQDLHICYFKKSEDGKSHQPFAPLLATNIVADTPDVATDTTALASQYEQRWLSRHVGVEHADKHALLDDRLQTYQLSATHLNSYLDVTRGGPLYFLTQNFLHFPASQSIEALYGSIVHDVLRRAHDQINMGSTPDIDALITHFKAKLAAAALSNHDRAQLMARGEEHLRAFFTQSLPTFSTNQRAEVSFKHQGITLGDARLTGSLDRIDLDDKNRQLVVVDYKTGEPFGKWDLSASINDHSRVKLHNYRRQLLFYKLLVDSSPDWGGKGWHTEQGMLQFIKPSPYGKITSLAIDYEPEELEHTKQLIIAVWRRIMALDFPDVSDTYSPDLKGIVKFENDLIDTSTEDVVV
ncbi:MAG TPA: ATP-dependent DNA helicase [Candidatus Saccharimonadales bacterium]|nr:ATP-dependent DNA helicase [Candidatus Saccharimonadales bacterium]